jgi:hypothetical protein
VADFLFSKESSMRPRAQAMARERASSQQGVFISAVCNLQSFFSEPENKCDIYVEGKIFFALDLPGRRKKRMLSAWAGNLTEGQR